MRLFRAGIAALVLIAVGTACSGSDDTGSSGGWRVSDAHIRIIGAQDTCRTPSPVVDTFLATPSPQPDCTPASSAADATPLPEPTKVPVWPRVHTPDYHAGSTQSWHTIYTTYTPPPGVGIYQPMVHATDQPMPTPFTTPTPTRPPTPTPIPTLRPETVQRPSYAEPTPTPF